MVSRVKVRKVAATPRVAEPGAPRIQPAPDERMSAVDTAWLRMDSPANLMMIVGVWVLRPAVSYQALCQRLEERLLLYPRFGQRAQRDASGARWVWDRDFRIERHVVIEKLPRVARRRAQEALQSRLAELATQPLDSKHPLWQFHLVEHYQGGSALLLRIHHCIADGMALLAVAQSLMDDGLPPPRGSGEAPRPAGGQEGLADALLQPFTTLAVQALTLLGDGATSALRLLREPCRDQGLVAVLAGQVFELLRDAAALALMADDAPTRLKGVPGPRKRIAWCQPLALEEVKAVGRALNCSVNDVLLSCVAGALGRYLSSLGDAIAGKEIRAMVPVNLRPLEQAHELGNRFGLAPVLLPIGLENPVERLYELRRRMADMKASQQALLVYGLLALAGLLPKPAQDALLQLFSRKTTLVMSNVPGPRDKLRLCGATLEQSLFWVPQSGTVGLGVSILSYGGGVHLGLISDVALCPDPQKIMDEFEPEFNRLALVTLMLPWGE